MKWIPLSERKPAREDADKNGRILFRWHDESCGTLRWDEEAYYASATHWTHVQNIELPPPAPVMPERLEYVKCKPGEEGGVGAIAVDNESGSAFHAQHTDEQDDLYKTIGHTLYRRVEPGKRIVFEIVDEGREREPLVGERYVAVFGDATATCKTPDRIGARTILRCVEGEEYLK